MLVYGNYSGMRVYHMSDFETWYRGEGVNVAPARPEGSRHDLKDGVYFADTEKVASIYATERAPSLADRRVYKVSVDRGSMRVLDLTAHPGWQKLMQTRFSSGETPEMMLKRQPAAEEYEKWFNSFLKINKVDLDRYDAVIGPEFRNGGKQMCILHKSGQPSSIAGRLRGLFVPVNIGPVPATPPGRLRWGGKIGSGLRGVGGSVGGAIAMLGLQYLAGLLIERSRKLRLDDEMKRLGPDIDKAIRARVTEVANVVAAGKRAYANITVIRIERTLSAGVGGYSTTVAELPKLEFEAVAISDQDLKIPEAELKEQRQFHFDNVVERYRCTFSVEIELTQEELDLYRAYANEIRWYEAELANATSRDDVLRLSKDKAALETKFRAAVAGN
ncbi:MAG TPA: hypothetical protein VEQ63_14055 [Bryobacteraceae bacterium]|nr:hypothetical protein [Bryobacteraceae bacterium]